MKIVHILLLVSMAIMISGCSRGNSNNSIREMSYKNNDKELEDELRIACWGTPLRMQQTEEVIELFQKENPKVKVILEFSDWESYWDKLEMQAAIDELPDIIQQDNKYIEKYVSKDLLTQLDSYIEEGIIGVDNVDKFIQEISKVSSKTYGMCLGINTQVMVYNKDIVEQAGAQIKEQLTWEEYEDICRMIFDKTGVQSSVMYTGDVLRGLEFNVRNAGYSLYDKDEKKLGFDDTSLILDFFDRVHRLKQSNIIPYPEVHPDIKTIEESLFVKEYVWNEWVWSNQVVDYMQNTPASMGLTFIPQTEGYVQHNQYLKPSMYFSITEASHKKEIAAKFLDFYINSVDVHLITKGERGIPVSRIIREEISTQLGEAEQNVFSFLKRAIRDIHQAQPPEPVGAEEITTLATGLLNGILYGEIKPVEATKRFMEESNIILAE